MTDAPLPANLEAFLNAQRVAHLATVDAQSRPHVVPVCFAYRTGTVYIALDAKPKRVPVRELRRVRNLIANPSVQLLVDVWDEDWTRLAYLQLRGLAAVIEAGAEQAEAVRLLRERYLQYVSMAIDDAPVIRIAVRSYQAWGAV
jgi:coenzyme F420-0:L-glutamate ligase / coenzyme F420-1:gamma-L-glutamate ligase